MKKLRKFCFQVLGLAGAAFLLAACAAVGGSTFDLEVPGYRTEVGKHVPSGTPRNVIVISLHGKKDGRKHGGNLDFANQLASAGYTTYTPQMPWFDYGAPLPTAYALLDALVKKVATKGQKVVVAGHSQGAPYALFYTSDYDPPANVVASVLLAPGHLIHRSYKIQGATAASVARAKLLIVNGDGDKEDWFDDFNGGGGQGAFSVWTTPANYVTYFDLDSSPNFMKVIARARKPILWVDGKSDRLAKRMYYSSIFGLAPKNPQNKYLTVSGGHVTMWGNAAKPVIEWLKKFE